MVFTPTDFHDTLDTDLWILDKILTLPSDPIPVSFANGDNKYIMISESISMPAQQKAVENYRKNLLPAIFLVAQKIYAGFFRLVVGNSNQTVGNRQIDVQHKISELINSNSIIPSPPFLNYPKSVYWWNGQFDYDKLRDARNQVVHNKYSFNGSNLSITKNDGTLLLNWSEFELLEFSRQVLLIGRAI